MSECWWRVQQPEAEELRQEEETVLERDPGSAWTIQECHFLVLIQRCWTYPWWCWGCLVQYEVAKRLLMEGRTFRDPFLEWCDRRERWCYSPPVPTQQDGTHFRPPDHERTDSTWFHNTRWRNETQKEGGILRKQRGLNFWWSCILAVEITSDSPSKQSKARSINGRTKKRTIKQKMISTKSLPKTRVEVICSSPCCQSDVDKKKMKSLLLLFYHGG